MSNFKNSKLYQSIRLPIVFIIVLWVIHLLPFDLGMYGVYPRTSWGLRGVFFMPLIHGDWGHLISNTPPLFVLSAMVLFFYRKVAVQSFIMIYLLSGLAVWLFARPVFHIGASGVIYGLVAFVFWNGIFRRNIKAIVLALIVMFYYGGLFVGILPGQEGISWEGHLFGGVVGIFVSYWMKDDIEQDEEKKSYSWENEPQTERNFLDRDTFEQTKEQRRRNQNNDQFGNWNSTIF